MYQRGGVERLVASPAPPLASGEHAQLVVDERDQRVEGPAAARTDFSEETGHRALA